MPTPVDPLKKVKSADSRLKKSVNKLGEISEGKVSPAPKYQMKTDLKKHMKNRIFKQRYGKTKLLQQIDEILMDSSKQNQRLEVMNKIKEYR